MSRSREHTVEFSRLSGTSAPQGREEEHLAHRPAIKCSRTAPIAPTCVCACSAQTRRLCPLNPPSARSPAGNLTRQQAREHFVECWRLSAITPVNMLFPILVCILRPASCLCTLTGHGIPKTPQTRLTHYTALATCRVSATRKHGMPIRLRRSADHRAASQQYGQRAHLRKASGKSPRDPCMAGLWHISGHVSVMAGSALTHDLS